MGITASNRGGAGAGRGDDPYAAEYAKRMGVPQQWVTGPGKAKFTGSIVGHDNGNVWFTAESTGGGETDSHQIPFVHPSMGQGQEWRFDKHFGVDRKNPSKGQKWVAEGEHKPQGIRADSPWGMNWTLRPARDDD